MASDERARWGWIWLVGLAFLVIGVIVAVGALSDDDAGTSSAADGTPSVTSGGPGGGPAAGGSSGTVPADCQFLDRSTTLKLDGALATALAGAGIEVAVIAPATGSVADGIVLPIVTSRRITCGDYGRVIGHRGGIELALGRARVQLRRLRITTATGRVDAFLDPRTTSALAAFRADLDAALEPDLAGVITLRRVPLTLTPAGATALNAGLDTRVFVPGAPVGLLDIR